MEPTRLSLDQSELQAMIRERAFELFALRQEEGRDGSPQEDWDEAAAEIAPYVSVD